MLEATLLWIDAGLNLILGVGLLLLPTPLIRALGLPEPDITLYPRVFGGVLVGIAVALVVQAVAPALGGLGLGGAVAINLCGAAVLIACLVGFRSDIEPTGRIVLWLVVFALILLSAVELFAV